VSTRLGRIETQITDLKTAVESRQSDIVDDTANDADTEGASAPRVFKKTGPVKHRSRGANRFNVGFSRFA
jgi:hypothetical protein